MQGPGLSILKRAAAIDGLTHWGAWLGLALALLFLANAPALAAEPAIEGDPIIFEAFVNGVRKGDCLAVHVEGRTESIWVEAASIEKWGVAMGAWQIGERDGTRFARLVASDRMRLAVDMDVLRLSVEFSPEAFGTQRLDLSQAANDPLSPLAGRNGYLDYSLGARWASGAGSSFSAALAATTALGPWILRSEHNLASGAGQFEHVRVRSFAQFDWPGAMSRLSIGDVDAGGGALSQIGPLGGIRFFPRIRNPAGLRADACLPVLRRAFRAG